MITGTTKKRPNTACNPFSLRSTSLRDAPQGQVAGRHSPQGKPATLLEKITLGDGDANR